MGIPFRSKDSSFYFTFEYPSDMNFLVPNHQKFLSFSSNPYEIERQNPNPPKEGYADLDFYPFKSTLSDFCLPLKFITERNLTPEGHLPDEGWFSHTLIEMEENDMNIIFFKRAFEYLKSKDLETYLEFHFGHYAFDLADWLQHLGKIVAETESYLPSVVHPKNTMPTLSILSFKRQAFLWIENKRKLLLDFNSSIPAGEISPVNQLMDLQVDNQEIINLDRIGHRIVLLKELGVIDLLEEKYRDLKLKSWDFAKLICLILNIQNVETVRKAVSGYGRGTKDDPKTGIALKKVENSLNEIGINFKY